MDEKLIAVASAVRELKTQVLSTQDKMDIQVEDLTRKVSQVRAQKGDKGEPGPAGQSGSPGQNGKDGSDGEDAPKIVDIYFNEIDNHLMFQFNDGTEIDAGEILVDGLKKQINVFQQRYLTKTVDGGGSANQEVFIDEQPTINYPAISFLSVVSTDYYTFTVNVP